MEPRPFHKSATLAVVVWSAATVLVCANLIWVVTGNGGELPATIDKGPLSNLHVTLMAVGVSWMLVGAFIFLWWRGCIDSRNIAATAGFFAVSLLYVNVLRERPSYGDIHDYVLAAFNLHMQEPLHPRYLYPPFWAAVLEPLLPFGPRVIFDVAWLLNLVSLFGMYFLLPAVLRKYGFSSSMATLVTFAWMLVNVPILRTLGYVQVNLHVTNLILLSLLFYPRSALLSALALALAVQFKVSPLALVLLFVLERDFRWVLWFLAASAVVIGATVLAHGWSPYRDFWVNIRHAYSASGIAYRENSIDSWFRALGMLAGWGEGWVRGAVGICKAILVAGGLWLGTLAVKHRSFHPLIGRGSVVFNGAPVMLVLMMMASPLVWEHHGVFVGLSYLLVLKGLSSSGDGLLYGLAYTLEFLIPTFDFFPWSYGRLLSPLLLLILVSLLVRKDWPSRAFLRANDALEAKLNAVSA